MDISFGRIVYVSWCIGNLYYVMNKKFTEDGFKIKSYQQKTYKVWFGGSIVGIISEDSLNRYGNIKNLEEYGMRTIYYIEQNEV